MGKKYRESLNAIDSRKTYEVKDALDAVLTGPFANFDETVEIHLRLGVDSRHADQQVRGSVVLPNGTGKDVRVLVFAEEEKQKEAKEAGADFWCCYCVAKNDASCRKVRENFRSERSYAKS